MKKLLMCVMLLGSIAGSSVIFGATTYKNCTCNAEVFEGKYQNGYCECKEPAREFSSLAIEMPEKNAK